MVENNPRLVETPQNGDIQSELPSVSISTAQWPLPAKMGDEPVLILGVVGIRLDGYTEMLYVEEGGRLTTSPSYNFATDWRFDRRSNEWVDVKTLETTAESE